MHVRLIAIDEQGCLEEGVGRLDDMAKQVCRATVALYRSGGFVPPWIGYLATHDRRLVGACAFKAAPKSEGPDAGKIEIGYLTFPQFEGRGIATEMVRELLRLVRSNAPELTVVARTAGEENASNAILRKFGFQFAGEYQDPEDGLMWLWELPLQKK